MIYKKGGKEEKRSIQHIQMKGIAKKSKIGVSELEAAAGK